MLFSSLNNKDHFKSLAADRQMTSLIDKEIIAAGEEFSLLRSDWVTLFYDQNTLVTSDDGTQYAYRAITTWGKKLWLVFSQGKTRGDHTECNCPFAAFVEARDGLDRRWQITVEWPAVQSLVRALRKGSCRQHTLKVVGT